jgi:hypothetical protein
MSDRYLVKFIIIPVAVMFTDRLRTGISSFVN